VSARDIGEYIGEFTPAAGKPAAPCQCGDRVFYQLSGTPWICRSCHPPGDAGWRTVECRHDPRCDPPQHVRSAIERWFVVPEGRP
jgi:hypothetical protein